MNKPQYLAELDRLLIFMTSTDRAKTLARVGALFDQAGPEGIDALVRRIGSPTAAAIRLSRTYEPGNITDSVLDEISIPSKEPAPGPKPESAPELESKPAPQPAPKPAYTVPSLVLDDLPGFEPPPIPSNFVADEPEPGPEPEEEPEEEAESEEEPEPEEEPESEEGPGLAAAEDYKASVPKRDDIPDWMSGKETSDTEDHGAEAPAPASVPAKPAAAKPQPKPTDAAAKPKPGPGTPPAQEEPEETSAAPAYTIERTMPLAAGIPLFILSLLVIAVPLALVCLLLAPVLALPGVALLLGAWLAAVGGLWCISYIADAVMLFGLALVALAAALVVLWLGLWLLVAIVSLYIRGMKALAHLTLGKKVSVHA